MALQRNYEIPTGSCKPVKPQAVRGNLELRSTLKYGSAFKNGALKKDVSVTINGGGEADVSDLIDKNLFADYKQFAADVKAQGHDVSDIDAGTYSFKKGASVESVISDLVG